MLGAGEAPTSLKNITNSPNLHLHSYCFPNLLLCNKMPENIIRTAGHLPVVWTNWLLCCPVTAWSCFQCSTMLDFHSLWNLSGMVLWHRLSIGSPLMVTLSSHSPPTFTNISLLAFMPPPDKISSELLAQSLQIKWFLVSSLDKFLLPTFSPIPPSHTTTTTTHLV